MLSGFGRSTEAGNGAEPLNLEISSFTHLPVSTWVLNPLGKVGKILLQHPVLKKKET